MSAVPQTSAAVALDRRIQMLRTAMFVPGITSTPRLAGDNNAANATFVTGYSSKMSAYERALNMRISFMKDVREQGTLETARVDSEWNVADIGTKFF